MWICEHVDMWICGYVGNVVDVNMWICGHVDMWICGYVGNVVDVKVVDRDKRGTGPNQSADTHVQVYTSHWRKMQRWKRHQIWFMLLM